VKPGWHLKNSDSTGNTIFHPFCWLLPRQEKIIFFITLAGTVTVMCVLSFLDQNLKTSAAPYGIVSFEFSGTLAVAKDIINGWGESGRILAGFHLGLDYLFLIFYPIAISIGCALAATHFHPNHKLRVQTGLVLSWAQIPAGLFDAVENWALLDLLRGSASTLLPGIAWWCAFVKFIIVISGLTFLVLVSILIIIAYIQKSRQTI